MLYKGRYSEKITNHFHSNNKNGSNWHSENYHSRVAENSQRNGPWWRNWLVDSITTLVIILGFITTGNFLDIWDLFVNRDTCMYRGQLFAVLADAHFPTSSICRKHGALQVRLDGNSFDCQIVFCPHLYIRKRFFYSFFSFFREIWFRI